MVSLGRMGLSIATRLPKAGIALPLTEAFYRTCEPGPRIWHDNMDRPYTSFWYMLNHKGDD